MSKLADWLPAPMNISATPVWKPSNGVGPGLYVLLPKRHVPPARELLSISRCGHVTETG